MDPVVLQEAQKYTDNQFIDASALAAKRIVGIYESAGVLAQKVTAPATGNLYAVGTKTPYDIYFYNEETSKWVNLGPLQGQQGDKGEKGDTGSIGSRGTTWFYGTLLTSTDSTEKIASSSISITDALVGDIYLNTDTMNIYRCVEGNTSDAAWQYIGSIRGASGADGVITNQSIAQIGTNIPGAEPTVQVESEGSGTERYFSFTFNNVQGPKGDAGISIVNSAGEKVETSEITVTLVDSNQVTDVIDLWFPTVQKNGDLTWSREAYGKSPETVNILGKTPVRTVDYWTKEDQESIISQATTEVINAFGTYEWPEGGV